MTVPLWAWAAFAAVVLVMLAVDLLAHRDDHVGIANGEVFNGANDNASGTASVIEVANALATLKQHLGSLNRVKRVVKVLGMVNAVSTFERHPFVINGCSELFAAVWGEANGIGVRSAVGMGSLPDNIPVEIEAMFELEP